MSRRVLLAFALLTFLLAGCGYEKTWVAGSDLMQLTPKPGGYDMPVFRGGTDRAHKLLGELSVTTQIKPTWSTDSSVDRIATEFKKEAIRRGADAVINLRTSERDDDGHTRMTVSGRLILFTSPPPVAARS